MDISFHSHLDSNTVIATKFCTWHDSCAVVACAKICCDLMASNGVVARRNFDRIWIAGKKPLVKRAPVLFMTGVSFSATVFRIVTYHVFLYILKTLQWRHNERDGVSNHRRLDCLHNRLFSRRSKETSKFRVTGIHRWPVDSPHKGPVTRQMFLFDDIITKHWTNVWSLFLLYNLGFYQLFQVANAFCISVLYRF